MRSFSLPGVLLLLSATVVAGCSFAVAPEPTDESGHGVTGPAPVCSDGLVTRTQGFWKNHSCVVKGEATGFALVPVSLGSSLTLEKPANVKGYFDQPTQGNKQIILGHQLLASKLNVAAFAIGDIAFADWDGDGNNETVDQLVTIGDGLFDAGNDADRVRIATILDKLNNAGKNADLWFDPKCKNAPASCD